MLLTKTVEESDYKLIEDEVNSLKKVYNLISHLIDIGHEHRFWEYGMALKALTHWCWTKKKGTIHIIDVGAGDSLLGPTVLYRDLFQSENESFLELEPRIECYSKRVEVNKFLSINNKDEIKWVNGDLDSDKIKGQRFDVVFCISVIEHVSFDSEFLRKLSELVAPGGLLFMTTDVVPIMPGKYHFDNLRAYNYTTFDVCKMVKYLDTEGFRPLGEVNLEYKGDKVFDYSFCSVAMVKQ